MSLGLFDIRQRYRRSAIGPFWIVISTAAVAGGITFMMSAIQDRPLTGVVAYILVGIIIFQFISTTVAESCTVFVSRAAFIKSFAQPISTHIFRAIWMQLLVFAHTLTLYPLVLLVTGTSVTINLLFVIPGLFILAINVAWVSLILATLSARFRDIPMVVGNLLSFLMFLTPVFWQPQEGMHKYSLVDYNPVYWLIQIVRDPMLGNAPTASLWISTLCLSIVGWALAFIVYGRCYKRLALWI
jgi:lipopolysaccharide transport system permease protein